MRWLDDCFHLIRCQDDELPSIDWVLDLARAAVLRCAGIRSHTSVTGRCVSRLGLSLTFHAGSAASWQFIMLLQMLEVGGSLRVADLLLGSVHSRLWRTCL